MPSLNQAKKNTCMYALYPPGYLSPCQHDHNTQGAAAVLPTSMQPKVHNSAGIKTAAPLSALTHTLSTQHLISTIHLTLHCCRI
jgi:hypothetical protein